MKSIRSVGLLIGLISLVLSCGPSGAILDTGADIRGSITNIHQADAQSRDKGIIGSLLIEGVVEEDTKFDKARVTITDKTHIFEQKGEDRRPVRFESLEIGQRVQARFTGPVMESYPVQATAIEIVILK
jgi:hypothetical protein